MALIDKASLLFVPSVVAEGKAFNVLPSGNRAPDSTDQNSGYDQTRADFDFDRGSNAAATRIGSDGLLKKYRENVLLNSNQFDTTWANTSSTETGGQADKDGGTDAWLLDKSNFNGRIYQTISFSDVGTFSVYAKAGTLNWMRLRDNNGVGAYFDLSGSGAVGSTASIIDAAIESIGNGWFRCSVSANWGSSDFRIYPADADGDTSGTTGSIYIQSAQLETGLVATDVLTSGATTGKAGVLVDLPRINYDANGENGSLLLEPSRANVYPYSEPFLGSGQTTNVSTYLNGDAFGIGVYGGFQLVAGSTKYYYQFSSAASTQYAVSFFVRRTDGGLPRIGTNSNDANGDFCIVASGSVKAPNDWDTTPTITLFKDDVYKFEGVLTTPALVDNFGHIKYSGNSAIDVQITGLQAEPNATYASSYIPNHSGTGGVTRAADTCLDGGSAESINSTEGVLYAEISALAEDVSFKTICLHDGTNTQRINIWYWNDGTFKVDGHNSNVQQFNFDFDADLTATNKIAVKYKANDFSVFLNGSKMDSDTSGATPIGLNTLDFRNGNDLYPFYGNVKQVAVFNEALSDSELATLTTL